MIKDDYLTMNKMKVNTIFVDEFSKEIFEQTYSFGDEDINLMQIRVAKNLASIEENPEVWSQKFLEVLEDFKFVPGGRILSNAGVELKGTTYINCFVDGFTGKNQDSIEGILSTLRRQALILKSEGGYGFCADVMRPRGGFISGIGNETPGSIKMLELWDKQSDVITAGSGKKSKRKDSKKKIRKGAQMVTMSIWHPDIVEFITAKQTPGRLTKFNMSVLITNKFMSAVKNNEPWELIFPDFDGDKDFYDENWNGNLNDWVSLGGKVKTYYKYENANELWDIIMRSTYNRNEPGVLFVDIINWFNNLQYEEYISATNPCGEQILPVGGVCLLGSLNLTQFVDGDDWNYKKLKEVIPVAVRMMDNVNDLTYVPLSEQRANLKNKRRIGLGIMGYGSALMMMKIRYGSEKALRLTEQLMSFIKNEVYKASALLSKEKGNFPHYQEEQYLKSKFVQTLHSDTIELIKKYGIRNSHLLSIQPTGNTSILANIVSGGLEPVFLPEYKRTSIIPYPPDGLLLPQNINWVKKEYDIKEGKNIWVWVKEGDENILETVFSNGFKYKIDQNRGLTRETIVKDYAVRYLEDKKSWIPNADWAATTIQLGIDEHIETMKVLSRHIDSAMSKTINLPNDYKYDKFKDIYMRLYDSGTIKGGTTYRDGTMTTVLSDVKNNKIELSKQMKERPKTLECDIHHLQVNKSDWVVLVGLDEEDSTRPYEVFAFKKKNFALPKKVSKGYLTKVKRGGKYNLETEDGYILEGIREFFEQDEEQALTRMISLNLRSVYIPIEEIVEQLNKSEGSIVSFGKAIARTLKKYIPDDAEVADKTCPECGEQSLVYEEGCKKCSLCGYSAC